MDIPNQLWAKKMTNIGHINIESVEQREVIGYINLIVDDKANIDQGKSKNFYLICLQPFVVKGL